MKLSMTAWDDPPDIKVGDIVTMPIMVERKWWQFWKPRFTPATGTYRCIASSENAFLIEPEN